MKNYVQKNFYIYWKKINKNRFPMIYWQNNTSQIVSSEFTTSKYVKCIG